MNMYQMFVHPEGAAGEQGARLMARSGQPVARAAVRLLGLDDPTAQALEIGFGPGVGLEALAEQVPQGTLFGVDPSALMHRHATRRNNAAISAGRVVLLDGTAEAIPLPDASIDAAMMIDNLHFWPDPHAGADRASPGAAARRTGRVRVQPALRWAAVRTDGLVCSRGVQRDHRSPRSARLSLACAKRLWRPYSG